jgi:hypothetical protein
MERMKSPSLKKLLLRKCPLILLVILFSVINLTLKGKNYSNPDEGSRTSSKNIEFLHKQSQSTPNPHKESSRHDSFPFQASFSPTIPKIMLANNTILKPNKSNHFPHVNQDNPPQLQGNRYHLPASNDVLPSKSFLDDHQVNSAEDILDQNNHESDQTGQKYFHSSLQSLVRNLRVKRASSLTEKEKNTPKNNTRETQSSTRSTEKPPSKANKNG